MLTNNFTGWHCNTNRFTEEKAEESKKSAACMGRRRCKFNNSKLFMNLS
jgi:hypothetical protein